VRLNNKLEMGRFEEMMKGKDDTTENWLLLSVG